MSDGLEPMQLHSHDELQRWLADEVEVREELEELMGVELDVDERSLDVLESFLLARYRTVDDALRLDQRAVLDAAARHVGLVLLLLVDNARWDIEVDDPDDVFYELPVIRFPNGDAECPLSLCTACLERRTGSYLRGVVEGWAEDLGGS